MKLVWYTKKLTQTFILIKENKNKEIINSEEQACVTHAAYTCTYTCTYIAHEK